MIGGEHIVSGLVEVAYKSEGLSPGWSERSGGRGGIDRTQIDRNIKIQPTKGSLRCGEINVNPNLGEA